MIPRLPAVVALLGLMLCAACGKDDPVTGGPEALTPEGEDGGGGDGGGTDPGPCVPKTCDELQVTCSTVDNGCGTPLACNAGCPTTEVACADQALGTALPVDIAGNNRQDAGGKRRFQAGSCGANEATGDVGYERTYSWTAPLAGDFVFDTAGSTADTLIYLRRDNCSGPQLACDDNGIAPLASKMTATLTAGEKVIVVVDSATATGQGPFRLHINRKATTETSCVDKADNDADGAIDCLDSDCAASASCSQLTCADQALTGTGPVHLVGTTVGKGDDQHPGNCRGSNTQAPDFSYRFKAPRAGDYAITVRLNDASSSKIAMVYLMNSCTATTSTACAGEEQGVNSMKATLAAGQETLVVVDGYAEAGTYALHIVPFEATETICNDGADNDADGKADGADFDCPDTAPILDPTQP